MNRWQFLWVCVFLFVTPFTVAASVRYGRTQRADDLTRCAKIAIGWAVSGAMIGIFSDPQKKP